MSDYFQDEVKERTSGFNMVLGLVALMTLSITGVRLYNLLFPPAVAPDPTLILLPSWYLISNIVFGITALIGLYFTYNFKKIGVYLTVASLFLMVSINPEFSLDRTVAPLFTLFLFCGFGLFEILPKWKFFD